MRLGREQRLSGIKSKSGNTYPIHQRRKVPKSATKPIVKVTISPGPATEFRKKQWTKFWRQLAARVRDEVKASER